VNTAVANMHLSCCFMDRSCARQSFLSQTFTYVL